MPFDADQWYAVTGTKYDLSRTDGQSLKPHPLQRSLNRTFPVLYTPLKIRVHEERFFKRSRHTGRAAMVLMMQSGGLNRKWMKNPNTISMFLA